MKKAKLPNSILGNSNSARFALTAVATAMLSLSAPQAYAQNDNDEGSVEFEEIVVTGIRSSLERASDIKRNNSGVVDAISAEDIGKFPDTNLAESLQRITGVSISRQNNEGSQVTVRGFGPRFNLVTLNGRTLPTASAFTFLDTDRSFKFNELASSSVSAVEVYKTGRADLPTGGIGSTVNIKTAKPFDYDGLKLSGVAKVNHDTSTRTGSDFTPDVSFLASDRFADGKLGLLASVSYSERDSGSDGGTTFGSFVGTGADRGVDLSRNANPGGVRFTPTNFNLEIAETRRERTNAQFVLQYAPTENVEIALDYTLSRFEEETQRNQTGFWFEFNGTRTGFSDEQGVLNQRDINADIDFFGFDQHLVTDNDSFGLNIDWAVNDRLSFNIDAHSSTSEAQPDGEVAEVVTNLNSRQNVTVEANFLGGELPEVFFESATNPFSIDGLRLDLLQNQSRQVKNDVEEFKVVGTYDFDNGALSKVRAGLQFTEFDYDVALRSFDFRGFGDPSQRELTQFFPEVAAGLPIQFVDRGSVGSQFSGGGAGLFPTLGIYDPSLLEDILIATGRLPNFDSQRSGVNEETLSLFVQADFQGSLGGMPLTTNIGVRYEDTEVVGNTRAQLVSALRHASNEELFVVRDSNISTEFAEGQYDFVLPNIDFKLDINDKMVARLSYSETLSRSPVSTLSPSTNITTVRPVRNGDPESSVFNASQGNPGLEPSISENIDFSFEWYYKEGSYASIGLFDKTVNAFVSGEQVEGTLIGANGDVIRDPSSNVRPGCPDTNNPACLSMAGDPEAIFTISRLANSDDEGTVRGAEVALQHVFENGFGFIANYTYTDGDIEFDVNNFDQQSPEPLVGLSDSANLVVFYEKERFSARIAYNWRDDFFNGIGTFGEPVFVESFQQFDISASYIINDNLTLFLEGINVTDETIRRHRRQTQLLDRVDAFGPRYSFGIRGNF